MVKKPCMKAVILCCCLKKNRRVMIMKRGILLFLAFLLLVPKAALAQDYELENIINIALEKLDIPEYYTEFASRIQQDNQGRLYELSWRGETEDKTKGGYASAILDIQGRIMYYSNFEYGEFEGDYKLSSLDLNGAVSIAKQSMAKILPEFSASLRSFSSENYTLRNSQSYNISFYRCENSVPLYNNYVLASVDANTHKLTELSVVWDDVERFPTPSGIISPQRAQQLFLNNIGISLGYYNDMDGNPVLMYGVDNSGDLYINAYTGEVVRGLSDTGLGIYEADNPSLKYESDTYTLRDDMQGLTPYDMLESDVKDKIGMPAKFELSSLTVSDGQSGTTYYNASYLSEDGESVNVQVDAITGQITAYYNNTPTEGYIANEQSAVKKAERFVEKAAPLLFEQCERKPSVIYSANSYNIFFTRLVDGIKYKNNGLLVIINGFTGEITAYRSMWTQKDFPIPYPFISQNEGINIIFENVPFQLQYVPTYKGSTPGGVSYKEVSLVYAFLRQMPLYVNAETGKLCNVFAQQYKPVKTKFLDVEGHIYEQKINTLLQCGVLDEGEFFLPEEPLLQADYFKWMHRAVNVNSQEGIDQIYNQLYNNGVVTQEEREDEKTITLEEAVMYLIRFLGYGEVAQLPDTYQTGFLDEHDISPELIGYAAIAKGFGIVKGDVFLPKRTLTRAAGANIVYNLLTSGSKGNSNSANGGEQ